MMALSMSRRIWRVALGENSIFMNIMLVLLLIAAAVGGVVGISMAGNVPVGLLRGAGNPLSVLAVWYWALFMSGAAAQNKPANACLVPGLTGHVRRTAALAWLLAMIPIGAVSWAHPQGWLVLLSGSVGVTAFGLYRAGDAKFSSVAAVSLIVYSMVPAPLNLDPALMAAACLLSLAFAAWSLYRAFPQGGERHHAMLGKHEMVRAMDTMEGSTAVARSAGKKRSVYNFMLRRELASGDRGHLLLHVLGPSTNRLAMLGVIVAVAAGIAASVPLMAILGLDLKLARSPNGAFSPALCVLALSWYRFVTAMRLSAGEQAIARLVPGLPAALELNRELGRQIFTICIREWGLAGLLMAGLLALWNAPVDHYMVLAGFLAAVLPMTAMGLADHSGKYRQVIVSYVLLVAFLLVLAFIAIFWTDRLPVWTGLMATILGIAIASMVSDWRTMMAAPPAFPAGRMA